MSFFYFLQRERNTNNHFVDRPVIFYEKTQTLSNLPSYKCNRKGPNSILRNLARQHAKRVDVALSKNLGSLKYFDSHKAKAFVVIKKNKQIVTATEIAKKCFWNQTFDKGRLKNFVLWFFLKYGEHKTVRLVEELKTIGFQYATKAGISLGVEDLKIPPKKAALIYEAEKLSLSTIRQFKRGEITEVERFQRLIDTWHRTSEQLKIEVIENFEGTDVLNPVYMMAFSGARGNISQVRQLVGMRGLMSNPQGQIIDFPIRSNFREGLTLTEYIISSYGARKGIVDTALRTANAGYLTRRLVDVAQHVIISTTDCGTTRGIFLNDMKEGNKTIYSLQNRLVGRVLARDVYNNQNIKIASKNMEISGDLAILIAQHHKKIFVRSPLTCQTNKLVCQLCYGWSLAQGNLVSIGEAVGIVAAQSIGEPGTQLTMRTFHTGGVFSGNVSDQIKAPFDGFVVYNNPIAGKLIRTPEGKIAFLTKDEGSFSVYRFSKTKRSGDRIDQGTVSTKAGGFDPRKATSVPNDLNLETLEKRNFKIPFYTLLFLRNREKVFNKQVIAQISSINRQKTATDQAELTIKAEISGLFYSKNLEIEETRSGPGIKENTTGGTTKKQSTANTSLVTGRRRVPKKALAPQSDQSAPHFASEAQRLQSIVPPDALQEQSEDHLLRELDIVDQSLVDIINKAWNWGYAWILSGKIYQLPFPSTFFPIFGDFVTKKTYMNCINWYLPSTFGSGFKINRPLTYSVFNQKTIKKMRQTLFSKEEFNLSPRTDKLIGTFNQSKNLNKAPTSLLEKDFKLLKYDLISFELSNILYKKIGYFLNLSQASHTSTMDARGFAAGDHLQDNQEIKTSLINVNQNYALPVVFPQSVLTSINPRPELRVEREVEVYHPRKAVISLDAKSPVLASSFLNNSKQSLEMPQRSILSLNDTLFLYSGLFPKNRYFADIKTEKSLKINNNKPLINPTNWEPSFSVFLNWFPKRFFTKTAGILFLELFSPTNKKISLKNETRSDTINIFSNSIGSFLTPSNTGAGAFTTESRKDNKYKSQYLRLTSMLPSRTSRVTRSYGLQRAERVDGDKHTASLDKSPLDFTINFSSRINTKIDELHPSSRNASSIERGLSLKRLFTRNNPTDKTNKFNKLNNLVKTSLQKSLKKSSINNARIATTVPTFFKNELLVIRPTEGHIGNQFSFGKKSTTPVLDSFDNVGSSVGEPGVHKRPFLSTNSQMLELPQSETSTGVNSPLEKEKSFTLTEQRQHAERVDVALINKQTIGELAQTLVHSKFTRSVRGQQYLMTTKNFEVPSKASTNIEISASDGRRQSIKTKGFFWKNHFKYNWSGPLQQKANRHYVNTQSVLTRSQLNNTIISSQRVFWVSQPFYKIHDKNNSIFINIVENFDGLQSGPEPTTQLGPHFKGSKINRYNSKPSHNGVFSLSENTTHLQKTMPIKSIKNSNENSPALVLSQINRQGQIHFNSFDPNLVQISKIKTTFNSQWPIDRERQTFVEASTINKTTSLDFNTSTGSGHNYKNQFFPNIKQNQSSKRLRQRAERVDNENMDCRYIKLTKGQLIGRLMYKQREFDKNQTNIQTRSLLCKKNNLLAHSVNTVNKNFLVDLKTFCRLNSPVDQYITSPAPFLLAKKKDLIINKKLNLVIDSFLGMKALNLYRKRLPSRTSRFTRSSVLQSAERIETNPDSSLQVQHQKHKRIRTSELALFDFYFYSLFTKQFNKTQPKVESMHQVNRSELRVLTEQTSLLRNKKNFKNKENNYKHICSPYLKEQFSKYLPNLSPIFKTKNRLIWSSYNNKSIQYHLFSEKHRQMFQRVNYLRHWFKKRNAFASMRVGQQINTLRQKKRNNIKRLSLQSTAKQNETESNIENFLNIWLKNGWFYYTTDLTQFLLNHKKLLPAGKNFDSHFIFDRDNIYIEILPLNQLPSLKTFVIGSSSSVDRLKKVTSKSDNSTSDRSVGGPKETLFGGAKQRPSVTGLLTERQQMSLKKQALQSVLVKHDLAESKTLPRRRLSNTKQSLFIKQQSWLTFIEKRTENILVTVTSTFNKKTEESTETLKHLNFKKVLINKKCRFNFNIDTNNASKSKNIDALPVTEPKHDIVRKSSNIESVTENTTNWSTTNNLLFKNQAKAAGTCQKNSYILLISKANEIPFFKEIESKKEIYELSKQQKQASNLYNLNKYQTYMLSPERRVKQIDENKTVNSLSFSIKKRSVNFALCAKFRMLIKTKNILKMLSNQSKTKMLNKVYNTSRLYTEYKTGIFNKQTITPQILSKYPSSELKIISNNSFSSFLSENEIDRQSNNVTEHTSKSVENSLTFKNNSNILSPLNKEHSAVLPTLMVTCLKTFNLAPFILSYKAPYSVNFPFKTPMCFFSEQYKPTKLFKKNHNTSPAALPRANITQKPLESKKVESTIFKKVISTYLLKIYLLHSSELDIAPKKIKDGQSPNKKENSAINGVFSKVVNKDSMAQALQSKYTRSASRLEAFFHSGPMGNAAPELRASREVQGYHRKIANTFSNLASMFFVPIAEYSLLNDFPKSIGSLNGDLLPVPTKQTLAKRLTNSSAIDNKKYLFGLHNNTSNVLARNTGSLFKGRSSLFAFGGDHELLTNKNKLYSIHFVSYINNTVNSQHPCIKTYAHSSVNGELIYRKKNLKPIDLESPLIYNELMTLKKSIPDLSIKKMLRQKLTDYFLSNKKVDHIDHSCMILTKSDQIAYSFGDSSQTYKNIYLNLEKLKTKNIYFINKMAINVLNLLANPADSYNSKTTEDFTKYELHELFSGPIDFSNHNQSFMSDDQKALITANSGVLELNNLPAGIAQQTSKLLVGEFLVYGDKIHPDFAISKSGQIIHINKHKITLRKGQPIFVSPQAILHKYDGDFVDEQTSVITLAYQQLKTGDIVQGIPKIEQFFEARTTKRGRLFRDSLENLLKALFNRYVLKLPREQAVRQSFYKIQQIIIDGVQRVYRSQGVTIADKHLEVIVKQMTSKVRITFGGSTGYLPGEICDLYDIELLNKDIRPKILYEPIVLGITKASLEVKSFLSAASFQQTTRVLTKSALSRKNDYLNGLKENVILGNLIPAGTGYLVYLDGDGGSMTPLKHLA